jgi:hypothetical protein
MLGDSSFNEERFSRSRLSGDERFSSLGLNRLNAYFCSGENSSIVAWCGV